MRQFARFSSGFPDRIREEMEVGRFKQKEEERWEQEVQESAWRRRCAVHQFAHYQWYP